MKVGKRSNASTLRVEWGGLIFTALRSQQLLRMGHARVEGFANKLKSTWRCPWFRKFEEYPESVNTKRNFLVLTVSFGNACLFQKVQILPNLFYLNYLKSQF
jgi:hypothetical protein